MGSTCPMSTFFHWIMFFPMKGEGMWIKKLLQSKARWIYKLSAAKYPGLIEAMSFKPYLKNIDFSLYILPLGIFSLLSHYY